MTTDPMTTDPIKTLMAMDDEAFHDLVNNDTRNRAEPQLSAALRQPEMVERWYKTLMRMSLSVDGQIGAKTAENTAAVQQLYAAKRTKEAQMERANHERWRAGILRFKNGLDEKLLECRDLIRRSGDSLILEYVTQERNEAMAKLRRLEDAIRDHHATFPPEDDPSDSDLALWATVEIAHE